MAGALCGSGYQNTTNQCEMAIGKVPHPKSIGEVYDDRIQQARKQVERLCIHKAKLEAMNLLNHPYVEMRDLINGDSY